MAELRAIESAGAEARGAEWHGLTLAQIARIEIATMTLLIVSYTWVWQKTFKGAFLVCVALYVLIGLKSHLRRGESFREIGFRLDNLRTALGWITLAVAPIAVVTLIVGANMQTFSFPETWKLPIMLAAGSLWGMIQQYGLLAFFYRRLVEVLPGFWAPTLAASGLFSLFHLPNPFLMIVTLVAGTLACWVYRRAPNLLAIGIAHGALSMVLHRSMPIDVTMGMRVGPGFFRLLERLQDAGVDVWM